MKLNANKTKLVCTIGPACETQEMLEQMLQAGMNVARLNFSHGEFAWHKDVIQRLRAASRASGKPVAIMADLSGPKMRVGKIANEPVMLKRSNAFTLTADDIIGDVQRVSMSFARLPAVVKPDDRLFLNDGNIQLKVLKVSVSDVECCVEVGGELRSRKGLNLPGIDLGISAFTPRDKECLKFALEQGVDAISQSFVDCAADVEAVRSEAQALGFNPFIIAKIERLGALDRIDEILEATDGIMIARGDLGVETPIERMAIVQKQLTRRANEFGKPVITATQMLESMVDHNRPSRAEATDVANAILDGTDCVMLSEESAMGKYPVEAAAMLAAIAAATEPHRADARVPEKKYNYDHQTDLHLVDLISLAVQQTVANIDPLAVLVPTVTGRTARMVSRFRLPVWVVAVSAEANTCQNLHFSYGVFPVHSPEHPDEWNGFAQKLLARHEMASGRIVLTEGPSLHNPTANPRLEIIEI